jgi:hypothetical protein
MTSFVRSYVYASALALAFWFGSPMQAEACSVCQIGDPLYGGDGSSAQPSGTVHLYLETRTSHKESGALPHHHEGEEEEEEEEMDAGPGDEESWHREAALYASISPVDRLTLSASLPFRVIANEHQEPGERSSTSRNEGLGDLSLYGTFVLWRDRAVLPSRWIEGRLMLEAPTGRSDETIDGERDPHLQLGSGSWDWGLGLAGGQRFERGALYASVFGRWNAEGALDYEYGDLVLANLIATSDTLDLGRPGGLALRGGAELNWRYAGKDDFHGESYDDSGGAITYATPFLELPLAFGAERVPWLRVSTRLPLGSGGLHGDQREGPVYFLGVGVPLR